VVQNPDGKLTTLQSSSDYLSLLTILETDRDDFEDALKINIDSEKTDELFSKLFKCGLSGSEYWTELVIIWPNNKDINEDLKTYLSPTINNTKINQTLRHKVRTLLKE